MLAKAKNSIGWLVVASDRQEAHNRLAFVRSGGASVSKEYGFLQLRRGVFEHVRDGRMTITEALGFIYICSQADTRTGIWKGCAKSLSGELGIPERTARDILEKMQHGDYIRRFAVPGRHACYPILVHKFPITQGEHNGEHLNALESLGPADLRYFSREQGVEHGVEHGAAQRIMEKREERKSQKIESTAPALQAPISHPFFEIWNQNRGQLSEAKALGKGRLAKCRLRARDVGEERFLDAVRKAAATPFCLGLNDRGWKADFDWLIANDTNAAKVLEGKYDSQPQEPVWRQKQKLEEQQKADAVASFAKDAE